jgi:hypothetical protein
VDLGSKGKERTLLMGCPLYALEVDTFFVHFPERGKLAKAVDLFDHEVAHVVDLFLGIEPPEPKPDARVGKLVADAERS